MYRELFNLMMPLLKKFRTRVFVGSEEVWEEETGGAGTIYDEDGNEVDFDPGPPSDVFMIYLESDGTLFHDREGKQDIKDIDINLFNTPKQIVDQLLTSVLRGVEYRKNQFKELEMAKTIIDAITKGIFPKSKKSKVRTEIIEFKRPLDKSELKLIEENNSKIPKKVRRQIIERNHDE